MPTKNRKQSIKNTQGSESLEFISLADAAKFCAYSQDYLSLRARQGKLRAEKHGRNWVTTKEWLWEYLDSTAHSSKKNESLQVTLEKKIPTKTIDSSAQVYYDLKESSRESLGKLASKVSEVQKPLGRVLSIFSRGFHRVVFAILEHVNVFIWMLPKRLETVPVRKVTSWASLFVIAWFVVWSSGLHTVIVNELEPRHETVVATTESATSRVLGYAHTQVQKSAAFYGSFIDSSYSVGTVARTGSGEVLGAVESDFVEGQYGRLERLSRIVNSEQLQTETENNSELTKSSIQTAGYARTGLIDSLGQSVRGLRHSLAKFVNSNNERIHVLGSLFHTLHLANDAFIRPLLVSSMVPDALDSAAYSRLAQSFSSLKLSFGGSELDVVTNHVAQEQHVGSAFSTLFIGQQGEVVNLNTADQYNFAKIGTLGNDLLLQPSSGYVVKIGEADARHLSEQRLFEGELTGERSLLVSGMLEVQKPAFVDVTSREGALVLRQGGDGNLITGYNNVGDEVFSVSNNGIISAQGLSDNLATTKILQTQSPSFDSLTVANLTVTDSADVENLTVRGLFSADNLTVEDTLTVNDQLDVLGSLSVDTDTLVVDAVNDVVRTGDLVVTGDETVDGSLTVFGPTNLGPTVIDGDLIVNGSIIGGNITSGSGSSGTSGTVQNIVRYIDDFGDHVLFTDVNVSGLLGVGYLGVGHSAEFAGEVTIGNDTSDILTINSTTNINGPVTIASPYDLTVGGDVTIGGSLTVDSFTSNGTSTFATTTFDGVISLREISSVPAATADYGKLYVKSSDSSLYFKDDSGTEYNLLLGGGGSGSGLWTTSTDSLLVRPIDTGDVVVVGAAATTTSGYQFEVIGSSLFDNVTVGSQLTVEGTGTSTIAGDTNFDSGVLYIDSISDKVGLGTTSPLTLLTVGSSTPDKIAAFDRYNSAFIAGVLEVDGVAYLDGGLETTNTTSTNLAVSGQASTTNLTISNKLVVGNYTLPNADGSANYVLKTDGSGNVTWQADAEGTTINQLGQIGDVTTSTLSFGHVLTWNGSGWVDTATSSLNVDLSNTTGTITKDRIANSGTLSFDWTDAEVADALTIDGGTIDNTIIGGSTPAAGTFTNLVATDATSTTLAITGQASTTYLTVSQGINLPVGSISSSDIFDGSITSADIKDGTIALSDLSQNGCASGEVIKWNGSAWACSTDISGGGGGSGVWATSTGELAIYPTDTTDVVLVGTSATSSEGYIFEVNGASLFDNVTMLNATGTTLSISQTASTTKLVVSGESTLGTVVSGVWNGTEITDSYIADALTISGGTIDNTPIGGSTPSTGIFTNTTSTNLAVSGQASTTYLTVSNKLVVGNYTLPNADGSANYVLKTDGSGNVTWQADAEGTTINQLGQIGDVTTSTLSFGHVLTWNGSGWVDTATSSLNVDLSNTTGTITKDRIANSGTLSFDWTDAEVADALTIDGGTIDNTIIGGSTPAAGTFTNLVATDATSTTLAITGQASTTYLTVSQGINLPVGSISSSDIFDGSITSADIKDGTIALSDLSQNGCASGEVIKWNGSAWACSTDISGGGGGSGVWATSTGELAIYPTDTTDVVLVGTSATSSEGYIFEVNGASLFDNVTMLNATGTTLSISQTASTTKLVVSGESTLGTVVSGVWNGTEITDSYIADALTISGGTIDNTPIGGSTPSTGIFTNTTSTNLAVSGQASTTYLTISNKLVVGNYTLPNADGSANYVLKTDGSGNVTWQADAEGTTINQLGQIGDVTTSTLSFGHVLTWNGSGWVDTATSSLNVDLSNTTGTITKDRIANSGTLSFDWTDAEVADALTIDGGTIDNTIIGGSTPSTGIFTNTTSTNLAVSGQASTTNLRVSQDLTVEGSITGSFNPQFTTGSVVFQGASGLTQDNGNFFWDDSSNELGILTNTPIATFDVNGNFSITSAGAVSASSTIYSYNDITSATRIVTESTSVTSTLAGGLTVGSTNLVVDHSTGYVGIGTASPSYGLDVNNSANFRGVARFTGAVEQAAQTLDRIDIGVEAGTPRMVFEDSGASNIWLIDNSAGVFRWYIPGIEQMKLESSSNNAILTLLGSGETIKFRASGSSYINGGYLGIGVTSPTTLLAVGSSTPGSIDAGNYYNSAYVSGDIELDGTLYGIDATLTNTTSTNLAVSGQASTTNLTISNKLVVGNYTLPNADGSANYVLKTDGSGNVTWQADAEGTTINQLGQIGDVTTSTLSFGHVLTWNGSGWVDTATSSLNVDLSNTTGTITKDRIANSGTLSFDWTDAEVADALTIDGGTIDNTIIGGSTPSTGIFTNTTSTNLAVSGQASTTNLRVSQDLTVEGTIYGNLTGNVTGDITGDLTGTSTVAQNIAGGGANSLIYQTGSSVTSFISPAANSVLITNGSNVPSLSQTLPTAVQGNITSLGTITSGVWNGTAIGDAYIDDTITVSNYLALSAWFATTSAPQITTLENLATIGTITSGVWNGTAITDTYVANDLTIDGGTIDNTPIGGSTPSTGIFTNTTSTNLAVSGQASTTNLTISNKLVVGNYTLPNADGSANYVLKTDGSGNVTWQADAEGTTINQLGQIGDVTTSTLSFGHVLTWNGSGWVDTATSSLNVDLSNTTGTITKDRIANSGTLSFDWTDAEVADALTISGGTIGSNDISGTLTTTGTLTIGDGGDRIDIASDSWDVTNGTITNATWNGNVIDSSYLDTNVILDTEIDTSAELASIVLDETGTGALVFATSSTLESATLTTPTITGGTIDNTIIGGSTPAAGTFTNLVATDATSTTLAITGQASTTYLTVSQGINLPVGSISSSDIFDGSITSADIKDGTIALSDLSQNGCASGEVIKWNGSAWACSTDISGGGGGSGVWATSTGELAIYPTDTTDVVLVGTSATSSEGYIFEVNGASLFDNVTMLNATGTTLSISQTASTTKLVVSGESTLGTVVSGVWNGTEITDSYIADALTISGGTIDNTPIGGSTPSTGIFTNTTSTNLAVSGQASTTYLTVSQGINLPSGALDGAAIADNSVTKTKLANSGTLSFDWTDAEVADALTISGGTIDNTIIGGSTPAAGTFTLASTTDLVVSTYATATAVNVLQGLTVGAYSFPIVDGSSGYVLKTDGSGSLTWQADGNDGSVTTTVATIIVAASDSVNATGATYQADGTNDESEIESAINALAGRGGIVYLLEGTYVISNRIDIATSSVALVGAGPGTVIQRNFNSGTAEGLIYVGDGASNAYTNVLIADMTIDGQKASYASTNNSGIMFSGKVADSRITNVHVKDSGGSAIILTPTVSDSANSNSYNTIDNNTIENSTNGVNLSSYAPYTRISNNSFKSITSRSIIVGSGSDHLTVGNNVISNSSNNGVQLTDVYDATIAGNTIVDGSGVGMYISSSTKITISANTVQNNASGGITLISSAHNNTITGNTIAENPGDGLLIDASDYNTVSGNMIIGNTGDGVQVYNGADFNFIGSNNIYNNTQHGVYVYTNSASNTISANMITNSGGSDNYEGIHLDTNIDNTVITNNRITDTVGTGVAIQITNTGSSNNYLAGNVYSGTGASSIDDSGSDTQLGSQIVDTNTLFNNVGYIGLGATNPAVLLTVGSSTPGSIDSGNYYNSAYISGDLEVDGAIYGNLTGNVTGNLTGNADTATYLAGGSANAIPYQTGVSTTGFVSPAANSVLITNGSNVPSLSQTLPTAVQGNITSLGTITSGVWNGTAITDTYVANDLTIDGGTIDNTPIGGSTPSTGIFTNTTSTNLAVSGQASTTYLTVSQGINLPSGALDGAAIQDGTVNKSKLANSGTLSFDWTDAEVADALTISGGTIGSNDISGTLTTTGTLTIGDGGDRIDIASDSWDVTNGTITNATWNGNVIDSSYLDTNVILDTEIDTSAELASIVLDETGTGALVFATSSTLESATLTTPTITGGTIDNTIIGGSTPAAGTFTNLVATDATSTTLAITGQASTTNLTISNKLVVGNYTLPNADGSANYVLKTDGSGNVTWQADAEGTTINQLGQIGDVTTSTLSFGHVLTWNGSGWVDTATSSLNVDLSNTTGTITKDRIANSGTLSFDWTDAEVADALTIDGGTIDNTIIGGSTPSTGIFTNTTSTNLAVSGQASTTNLRVSQDLTVEGTIYGNLTGNVTGDITGDLTGTSTVAQNIAGGGANSLIYQTGSSVTSFISPAANSVLITNGSNVPSLSQTLPTAVQGNITSLGTITSGVWNGTAITDTYVANDLTIDGGTIDNTPIGGSTPSTGIFTNTTSTNLAVSGQASTTYLTVSQGINLPSGALDGAAIQDGTVNKSKLANSGTLSFDWTDAEVADALTISGGTIGSNDISGTLTTTGTLTIGDGGDRIDIASDSWDVTNGTITNATWNGNVIDSSYLDTNVILDTEIDTSAELASIVLDETGTGALVFATSSTLESATLTTPTITGGTIDNTIIGGSTPAAGTFTNLVATDATSTTLAITGQASTTNLTISNKLVVGNYTLPNADGSANYVLKTDGSGNVTWQADAEGTTINQLGQIGDVTTSTLSFGHVLTWNGSGWVDTATSSLNVDLSNTTGTITKDRIANSGTLSFDWTDAEVADALTIDGGTIDNTIIGGSTPSTGIFTNTTSTNLAVSGQASTTNLRVSQDLTVEGTIYGNLTGNVTGDITGDLTGTSTVAQNIAGGGANSLIYQTGSSVTSFISPAANSVLITNGSNVPSLSQTLPTAVQGNITSLGTITSGVWNGTAITDTYVANDLTIDGGTIDNTPIGGSTPSTGIFTNTTSTNLAVSGQASTTYLTVSQGINLPSGALDGAAIQDGTVNKSKLANSGTLSFDWTDAEVADALTISGGTIGSNDISGTLTTTGTLTIGDGGDRIDIASDSWDVTNGTITNATWNGNVIDSSYLDTNVILDTEIDTSAELASIVLDETGTGALVFATSSTLESATLTTPTITGGTIDNTIIGGSTPAAGTFTNLVATDATSTTLAITGQASTTNLTISNKLVVGNYTLPNADGSANYVLKTDGSGNVTWQADAEGTTINQLGQIGDVTTSTLSFGHVLTWNGSGWVDTATSSLNVDLSNTTGTITKDRIANSGTLSFDWTDAEVADALTISGGTIDNTPIGGSTPSTGIFTNTTSTNLAVSGQASTTNLRVSQNATVEGNLTVNGLINPGFTQGSVVFQGASGLTQDNTNFFWDDTNDKLGIGSSTPFATLSVQSTAATTKTLLLQGATSQTADILTLQNAGGDDLLTVDNDGRTVWSVATTTSVIVINQNGSGTIAEFQYQTSTVFAIGPNQVTSYVPFSVESTGDTGIAGTLQFTNPTASYIQSDSPLYITAGDLASNEDLILSANNLGDVIIDDTLIVQASSTNAVARFNSTGDGNSSNIIEIEDDGTDVAVFNSLGYLGLGTSTPTTLLAVGSSTPGSIDAGNYYNSAYVSGDIELDGTLYGIDATLTNTTSTNLAVSGQASTTNLTISNKLVVGNYTLPNADGSANYVLKTDGSGNVTWQADAEGTTINQLGQIGDVTTSTLSFGHVLTWNGSGWVDTATSSLNVDLSNTTGTITKDRIANSGTLSFDWTDAEVADALTIDGGTIDNTIIGGSTPSTGIFTNTTSTNLAVSGQASTTNLRVSQDLTVEGTIYGNLTGNVTGDITGDLTGTSTVAQNIAGGGANSLIYQTGSSVTSFISPAANSVLITNGSNVPSLSQTLPTAVQGNITSLGTITSGVWNGTAITDTYVANDLTIDGGTIDNTPIGGSTPSTGIFTNTTSTNLAVSGQASTTYLTVSQGINLPSGALDGAAIQDGTVNKSKLANSGTLSFDWTDAEVADALTISGGTIGSNDISGTLTTTGTLTIGDGGDRIDIASDSWDVTNGTITNATWNGNVIDSSYLDTNVILDTEIDTSAELASIVLDETGTGALVFATSSTLESATLTTPTITGGTIDNTIIGGSTPAAGTFTNLVATDATSTTLAITGQASTTYLTVSQGINLPSGALDGAAITDNSVTKTKLANSGTLSFDWTDAEVADALTIDGGTIDNTIIGGSTPSTGIFTNTTSTNLAVSGQASTTELTVSQNLNVDGSVDINAGTITNATATTFAITGQASTTNLTISNKLVVGNYTLPTADGSANYVLKTDGSGNVTWQADATGGGGGGTINQLGQIGDVTTSTLSFGHVLTWNGSGWVDTATSSLGLAATLDDAYNNDPGERTIAVDNGDVSWDLSGGNNFVIDIQGTADKFQVQDAGTVRFQIADTGVAELTAASSTAAALTIDQTSTGDILVLQNGGTNALVFDDSNYLSVYDSDASDYIRIYHDGTNGRIDVSSGDLEIGSGGGDLRVYDSAGTNYLQLTHDGSDAQISSSAGDVEIGVAGNDVLIGDVGSASNLVFEESSTISGQGGNTITVGVNGDTIDLGVSGVEYRVRDLVATGTSLAIDVNNTATTTVVFENTTDTSSYDELVHLAVEGTANFGATTSTEYNRFGLGTPGQAAISGTDDVFITGDIEVDGTAYLSGGTAWTQGDFAEEMSVYEPFAQPGDVIVINREFAYASSSDLYMGRLAHEGNSNEILGVITTDPAGILKFGVYGDSGQPIVLTGTSPVRVTDENGQVRRGDLLATSDTVLGAAMRATSAEAGTIGIALEDDNGSGLVSTLINVKNIAGFSAYEEVTLPDATSTSTATSTDQSASPPAVDPDIVVIDDGDGDQDIVVIDYEELANIRVEGLAEFTGSISVVNAEFTGRLLVLGEIIVAGDLDISGAVTTWFWDDVVYGSSTNPIELGDAVAVVGDNSVATMWANSKGFRPATGIAVAFKPFESLTEDDINSMPAHLRSKYDELTTIESVATTTATSTAGMASSTIVIDVPAADSSQFRMVKVAIGGVVKGYTDLIAGNRYFLSVNDAIVRDDIIADSDDAFQDVVNTIDDLLEQAENLSSTSTEEQIAGEEEILIDEVSKLSRTLSFEQPVVNGAIVQVVGVAKSATELLIQPSLNYSRYQDGYLTWDFDGAYVTSTVATSTEVTSGEAAVEVFQNNNTTIIVNNTGEEIDVNDYLPEDTVENGEEIVEENAGEDATNEGIEEEATQEVTETIEEEVTLDGTEEEVVEQTEPVVEEEAVELVEEIFEQVQTEDAEEQVEESPAQGEEQTITEA